MGFRLKLLAPVVLGASIVGGGCGDDDSTGPVTLNSAAVTARIAELESALTSNATVDLALLSGLFALPGAPAASVVEASLPLFNVTGDPWTMSQGQAVRDRGRAIASLMPDFSAGEPAVVLPPEVLGTTFTYNTSTHEYEASQRTGAPEDGVRFILYAVDLITRLPAEPLNETGLIDLRDLSTATASTLHVTAKSGTITFVDYEVSATATQLATTLTVDGTLGPASGTQLTVALEFTGTEASSQLQTELGLVGQDFRVLTDLSEVFTSTGFEDTISITVLIGNQTLQLAGTLPNGVGTLTFTVNNQSYATVAVSESGDPVVTGAGGRTLSDDDIAAIQGVFGTGFLALAIVLLVFIGSVGFLFGI